MEWNRMHKQHRVGASQTKCSDMHLNDMTPQWCTAFVCDCVKQLVFFGFSSWTSVYFRLFSFVEFIFFQLVFFTHSLSLLYSLRFGLLLLLLPTFNIQFLSFSCASSVVCTNICGYIFVLLSILLCRTK